MEYISYDVLVVGTGAAGYNAANRIKQFGKKSVAIITEGINCGTSRNTGSDKQTYYKLGLGENTPDSVARMAEDLFACGSVDGDTALCEAALSARCFLNPAEPGVEFPVNRYGEYIGYKTDHDPYARATSAGPLTSKYMTEALQKNAEKLGVEVLSGLLAVEILKNNDRVCGLICLEIESGKLQIFKCDDIIWATGGPAGIYADGVYPKCHTGSTSPALTAGECAGTHGITRPGGSALNAGQASSLRAAQYISFTENKTCSEKDFAAIAIAAAEKQKDFCRKMLANNGNINESIAKAQRIMIDNGGAIRRADSMLETENRILYDIANFENKFGVSAPKELFKAYKLLDILLMQAATLTAMVDFSAHVGGTRGSALYCDESGEKRAGLEEIFRFKAESGETANKIKEIFIKNGEICALWRNVRPIPENNDFFENIWRQYRENKNIY